MAKDGYKCTKPEENFVGYLMQGYTQRKAYIKAFPNAKNLSYGVVSINAYNVLKKPNVRAYYDELRHNIQEQIIEDAIWTKEQAMSELKDILYKNKRESDRYDEAYDDEIELLNKQIEERENEIKNPKGYMSKKKIQQLQDEIDQLKLAKINANKRHQSNKSVNEAILQAVSQLNTMCGYNEEKKKEPLEVKASITFNEDIPEED